MTSPALYQKLIAVQRDLHAPKSNYNKYGDFHYRSCEDILTALKPLLAQAGLTLFLTDEVVHVGEQNYVKATATVLDEAGEAIDATGYAREAMDKKKMDPAQMTGTASSYARKYALNGLFLIDDTKDADTDEYQRQGNSFQQAGNEPDKWGPGTGGGPITEDYGDDPVWQQAHDELVRAVEAKVPEIDGAKVFRALATIGGFASPEQVPPDRAQKMVEFANSERFLTYYTNEITPYLSKEK